MEFSFAEALAILNAVNPATNPRGRNAAFRIVNAARPGTEYVLNQYLPERQVASYQAKSGAMIVHTVMAGLVGMDSPYPEGGLVEVTEFDEETAKLALRARFSEKALRQLQEMLLRLAANGLPTNAQMVQEVMNFSNKVLAQSQLDAFEYLRGQALFTGHLNWEFNKKLLLVDYGIPKANRIGAEGDAERPKRVGADGYGGANSKFYADYRYMRRKIGSLRAVLVAPETADMIVNNPVHKAEISEQTDDMVKFRRLVGANERPSSDARDTVTLTIVRRKGKVIDVDAPRGFREVLFGKEGHLAFIGNNVTRDYIVGEGSQREVDAGNENALGITHIGPTVEGSGALGRWADVRTPDGEPWSLEGRTVANGLPIIEAEEKLGIAETEVA